MTTKVCSKCGWVYPITHNERSCRFCKEPFEKRFCSVCGLYTILLPNSLMCHDCHNLLLYTFNYKPGLKGQYEAIQYFEEWLKLIEAVPKPIKTLTEDDWIKACRYFGKCALCNSENIDARVLFIAFNLGGRYAAWNVLPGCDICATELKREQNPFVRYIPASYLSRIVKRNDCKKDNLNKVIKYLRPILEKEVKK